MLNNIFIFLLTIFWLFITIGIILLQIDRDEYRRTKHDDAVRTQTRSDSD